MNKKRGNKNEKRKEITKKGICFKNIKEKKGKEKKRKKRSKYRTNRISEKKKWKKLEKESERSACFARTCIWEVHSVEYGLIIAIFNTLYLYKRRNSEVEQ